MKTPERSPSATRVRAAGRAELATTGVALLGLAGYYILTRRKYAWGALVFAALALLALGRLAVRGGRRTRVSPVRQTARDAAEVASSPDDQRMSEAIYRDGVIVPRPPLNLAPETPLRVAIARADNGRSLTIRPAHRGLVARAARLLRLEPLLLMGGLVVYLLTHVVALGQFPIYFFCDEAIQASQASDLLQRGFRDAQGNLFPPYFQNAERWNLSLSVYAHTLSVALFGKSVLVTRATSVIAGLLGVGALIVMLRVVFKNRFWWAGALVLGALPTWLIHSRTAFEWVMMVACYAGFLATYLLYRNGAPRYLVAAVLFAAATFYSYSGGPGLVLVTGLLLALADLRFHLAQSRRLLALASGLVLVLAIPFLRYRALHPTALGEQAAAVESYWLLPMSLPEKLARFVETYLAGLSPTYWFLPNTFDLERHRFLGQSHLGLFFAPLALVGLVVCLRHWRSPAHRAVVFAILAIPASAALASLMVSRVLTMVVPATLLVCLGLEAVTARVRGRVASQILAIGVGLLLVGLNIGLLRAALVDGPTWFTNYGLYGMQYGAEPVFAAVQQELARDPATRVVVSPTWANNPSAFVDFFLTAPQRGQVQLRGIETYLTARQPLTPGELFILPAAEYEKARASGKLLLGPPERVIPYPDGQPGFYLVRPLYADNVDALFAADRLARQQLKEAPVTLDGQVVRVRHSLLDMGQLGDLFDHNPRTLIRGFEANPLVLVFSFPTPRPLGGLSLDVSTMDFSLRVIAITPSGEARRFATTYRALGPSPHVEYALPGGPLEASSVRLEIRNVNEPDITHIHVYELAFR